MSWRRAGAIVLVVAALLTALLDLSLVGSGSLPPGVDPAIAFYTGTHSPGYAGIDRWAYHGMKAESVVEFLEKDGYVCILPQAAPADGKPKGILELNCDKGERWPLARTLSIRANIDYDLRGRLVAAKASSAITGGDHPVRKRLADFLRNRAWIEPERLQIKGFDVDSADTLARLAVDALVARSRHGECATNPTAAECAAYARERREWGFPALAQGPIAVGNALSLESALERVRLVPLVPRGADAKPEDSLRVRVADGRMWMDFAGQDLAGHALTVSIALDSEGGAPVELVAKVGEDTRTVALSGERRKANGGAMMYLVPEAGAQTPRASVWLYLPDRNFPGTFKKLASELPNADPAFIPRIVKAVIGSISVAERPEEALGLYPALRSIELRADILRLARAELWLPKDQSNQLMEQAYRDAPATRAAWALAACEPAAKPPVIDADCWRRFTISDSAAAALLRAAVAELQVLYAPLEPVHPVRLRLQRMGDALARD